MDYYQLILEEWLKSEKPRNIAGAIEFYSPCVDKPRYKVVSKQDFHQYSAPRFQVNEGIAIEANSVEVDAILLDKAILCNGCVIHEGNIFSESISRNISEGIKLNPSSEKIIGLKSALKQWYRYCHYDVQSNTATIPEISTKKTVLTGRYFLFNSLDGQINFGHFVHDTLSQIGIYKSLKRLDPSIKATFIYHTNYGPYRYPMIRWLINELIGVDHIVLPMGETFLLESVYLPRKVTDVFGDGVNQRDKFLVSQMRSVVSSFAVRHKRQRFSDGKPIFVNRKDSTNQRSVTNIDQVEQFLIDKIGAKSVTVSSLSPEDVVSIFSQSNLVIGQHGAGLMNFIFAPKQSTLLEIEVAPNSCPQSICDFAHCYQTVYARIPLEPGLQVDINQLVTTLDKLISY